MIQICGSYVNVLPVKAHVGPYSEHKMIVNLPRGGVLLGRPHLHGFVVVKLVIVIGETFLRGNDLPEALSTTRCEIGYGYIGCEHSLNRTLKIHHIIAKISSSIGS